MDKYKADKNNTNKTMTFLADTITETIPKGFAFALFVFPFRKPGTANYISNARREDMIIALREKADILEAGGDILVESDAPTN